MLTFPVRRRIAVDDSFFDEGNQAAALSCKWAYLAPPQPCEVETLPVVCGIDGCTQRFASLSGLDAHYQSSHRHKCATCSRVLPSSHLLSIHVSERHDAYFAALARRGDRLVFECLVEGCGCTFVSDAARRAHLTVSHAYPKSFRFHRKPRPRKLQSQQPHTGATSASHAPDLRLPLSGSTKGVVPPAAAAPLIPLNAKSNWNNRSNPREECQDSCSRNDMEADSATSNEAPEAPAAQQQQQQWRRRPKKQRNPATTPCFFHTRTEKGCVRGDKCPFVHGERLVAGDGGDFAAKTADVATLGRYRSHSDADSDVDTGGGGDGMDSDDDMPVPNRSIAASSKGEPADAMTLDAADNNENLGNDLVDSVAKLRFMPRQISFGRRGGSHAGFSKS